MGRRGNKIALCARSVMESVTRKMSACKNFLSASPSSVDGTKTNGK